MQDLYDSKGVFIGKIREIWLKLGFQRIYWILYSGIFRDFSILMYVCNRNSMHRLLAKYMLGTVRPPNTEKLSETRNPPFWFGKRRVY